MDLILFENAAAAKTLGKQIFVFAGREDFLKERGADRLVQGYVLPEDTAENVRRIECQHTQADEFLANLNQFSFNDSARIFLLYAPESFSAANRKNLLAKMVENPVPPNVFILFLTQETGTAAEITRALGEKCEKIDFWPPFENKLNEWIQKECRALGNSISPEAADLLLDRVGSELRTLHQETVKLCLQAGKGGKVSLEMISTGVGYLKQHTVFDLMEKIGLRQLPEALTILENLLQIGEAPIGIFAMLVKTLREYKIFQDLAHDRPDLMASITQHQTSLLKLHGKSDFKANQEKKRLVGLIQEAARGMPEFFSETLRLENAVQAKNLSLALNFSRDELTRFWPKLLDMDSKLKSSLPNPKLPLQELLVELLSKKRAAF